MAQNEQVLVDRFCGGDTTAFHELVGQYKKKIYSPMTSQETIMRLKTSLRRYS